MKATVAMGRTSSIQTGQVASSDHTQPCHAVVRPRGGAGIPRVRRNRDHAHIAPSATTSATSTPMKAPVAMSHASALCPCMNWGSRCSPWTAMTIPLHVSTLTGRSKSQIRCMEVVANATAPTTAPTSEETMSTRTRRRSRASRTTTSANAIESQAKVHSFGSTAADSRCRTGGSKGALSTPDALLAGAQVLMRFTPLDCRSRGGRLAGGR